MVKVYIFFFIGPQISCFTPNNFTAKQASYVDTYCWDSLMHHELDPDGNFEEQSLWVHKVSLNCYFYFFKPKQLFNLFPCEVF